MKEYNEWFRKRLDISLKDDLSFDRLEKILEKTASAFPFENLCIIQNEVRPVTKENLMDKILLKKEGGLCYELNPLLYFFLQDNGFHVHLIRADVFNPATQTFSNLGDTHIAILLRHGEEMYLVDTGFGGNLPLKPVPLNGQVVSSRNGEFQIQPMDGEEGRYVLKMKVRDRDEALRIGYSFHPSSRLEDLSQLSEIQDIIYKHENSFFNKAPLITRLTKDGHMTLTNNSFTEWKDGKCHKEEIDVNRFKELAATHFGL